MSHLVLGASNLWFLQRPLRRALARATPAPCALHRGPGRAYCVRAGFLFLSYPPLLGAAEPPDLASVLLMDLGSDLVYGVPVVDFQRALFDRIREWRGRGIRVAVVPIFEKPYGEIGPRRYRILRGIFYHGSRLEFDDLLAGIREFNSALRALAAADTGLELVEGLDRHIGPDRLHFIRWRPVIERLVSALVRA